MMAKRVRKSAVAKKKNSKQPFTVNFFLTFKTITTLRQNIHIYFHVAGISGGPHWL